MLIHYWDIACLSLLCATWLRLTMQAAALITTAVQAVATASLTFMTFSAGMLLVDSLFEYKPSAGDLAMHSSLAVWNALILFGRIRGTSYAVRAP